ncbi:flagellar hook-length control protein FliK [Polaromonas sp. CG_23.6]|uniref:flagellar hook-length control protein FliK n=1 Tax=Polaromonas sp. CG_23.6 TaxID=2760709 RepID=UPI00247586E6|nr:flagellar hook-length control protein FliK [Polaromonas sp. CG_23.6]
MTPLLDTLLATRLAQRVDLVPLKSEVQVAGPEAVAPVEEVINDVRLPSRAAVELQLGVGLLKSDQRGHGGAASGLGSGVTLSAAARALSAILEGRAGAAAKVIGTEALLPVSSPLTGLAASLARTVGNSGLFYESHLAQFAAGTRALAELAQEPQARLDPSLKAALALPAAGPADSAQTLPPGERSLLPGSAHVAPQDAEGQDPGAKQGGTAATDAARSNAAGLAGIHPDAVALVRQQLELLAAPVFRWGGEAWPGVPMDWEIQEEARQPAADDEAAPRTWSTRVALTLPSLKEVEVRISLVGSALQVHMAASENTTRSRLAESRAELPERLQALGLQLTGLQIGTLSPHPAAKNGDAA